MLIERKHFTLILLVLLAFPAVALAAGGGEPTAGPKVGQAQIVPIAPLQRPIDRFQRVVHTISRQIKAEERAAARKRQREREEQFAELPGGVSTSTLEAIASCESGGDPTAVSSDGTYRGKYQFRLRHLGIGWRQRRPRGGPRGRTGLPGGPALRPVRLQSLARLRLSLRSAR